MNMVMYLLLDSERQEFFNSWRNVSFSRSCLLLRATRLVVSCFQFCCGFILLVLKVSGVYLMKVQKWGSAVWLNRV